MTGERLRTRLVKSCHVTTHPSVPAVTIGKDLHHIEAYPVTGEDKRGPEPALARRCHLASSFRVTPDQHTQEDHRQCYKDEPER